MRASGWVTVAGIALAGAAWAMSHGFSPYVGKGGEISRPTGYRAEWVHLGSWVVPDEGAPGYGFHDVYTQRETVTAYRKTGVFPDGAVLVKEIRAVESGEMTTGQASWAAAPAAWFVMVKDAEGRFPESPHWGDGWGWALFKADAPAKNVSSDYRKDCIPCHTPVKDQDWVYLKGYPTLRDGR